MCWRRMHSGITSHLAFLLAMCRSSFGVQVEVHPALGWELFNWRVWDAAAGLHLCFPSFCERAFQEPLANQYQSSTASRWGFEFITTCHFCLTYSYMWNPQPRNLGKNATAVVLSGYANSNMEAIFRLICHSAYASADSYDIQVRWNSSWRSF